jgi:hypothetical protein
MYPEALNKLDESLELYKKISEGSKFYKTSR